MQESPDDVNLAAALVQVVSLEAGEAAAAGNAERQRSLDEKASTMIAEYRKRYPDNVTFLKAECDLVARGGDWTRAIAITQEIDKVAKSTGTGAADPRPALRPAGQAPRGRQGLRRGPRARIPASPTSASCWPRS